MVKCMIITHGKLGSELVAIAEEILEQNVDVECICFDWRKDAGTVVNSIEALLRKWNDDNVLIFTDMFGGSPSNICFPYISSNIEIITGINLAGLLKFLTYRSKESDFKNLVKIVKKGAVDGINVIGEYLGDKKK